MNQVVIYLQHSTQNMWHAESPELPGRIGQASTLEGAIAPLKKELERKLRNGRNKINSRDFEVILYSQPLRHS